MAEYIEREGLLKWMKEEKPEFHTEHGYLHGITVGFDYALKFVKQIPSADVVEVVHGYWKETITHNGCTWDSDCVCSVCGKSGHPCNNYCEECGAKMDGKGG